MIARWIIRDSKKSKMKGPLKYLVNVLKVIGVFFCLYCFICSLEILSTSFKLLAGEETGNFNFVIAFPRFQIFLDFRQDFPAWHPTKSRDWLNDRNIRHSPGPKLINIFLDHRCWHWLGHGQDQHCCTYDHGSQHWDFGDQHFSGHDTSWQSGGIWTGIFRCNCSWHVQLECSHSSLRRWGFYSI